MHCSVIPSFQITTFVEESAIKGRVMQKYHGIEIKSIKRNMKDHT